LSEQALEIHSFFTVKLLNICQDIPKLRESNLELC
jgi:hypothetical protein